MSWLYFDDKNGEMWKMDLSKDDAFFIVDETLNAVHRLFGEELGTMWEVNMYSLKYITLEPTDKILTNEEYTQFCDLIFKTCKERECLPKLKAGLTQDPRYQGKPFPADGFVFEKCRH